MKTYLIFTIPDSTTHECELCSRYNDDILTLSGTTCMFVLSKKLYLLS